MTLLRVLPLAEALKFPDYYFSQYCGVLFLVSPEISCHRSKQASKKGLIRPLMAL